MKEPELHEALDGLMAYDLGAVDSGIHDEALRQRVIDHLHGLSKDDLRLTLSEWVRDHYLAPWALAEGYGIADVVAAARWLGDYMQVDP